MKIGIYSDIHDNISNLEKTLQYFKNNAIEHTFFCGDFCSPIPAKVIGNSGIITHCVFGNGDGDRYTIKNLAFNQFKNLKLNNEYAVIELNNKKIAMTHYPFYANSLARTGDYNLVLCGHTHEAKVEQIKETWLINPGEVMGWKGNASFVVFDFKKNSVEVIKIDDL
ncbi:MAG: metallophosphoesterase [Winogradskyella sp.]|uniref:metallophosphoesterase n=1 Tax=Winogradskyella sp. TaxID=1883156 RepID=UPI0017AD9686|nr:metallophosphoesterase [Winogradskyella sp.]MBT8243804.1 metallophosphoesterase [Winogradskyella sp.]NNK23412.1 metallophosphoesterase [Winogradskyella sp.]